MKFRWLLALPLIRGDRIIKNIDVPACRNCIYYKPTTYYDFGSSLNQCEKFGTKDIVSDHIDYDFANSCRRDEDKCGKDGKYFEIEPNLPAKMITHFAAKNAPIGLAISVAVLLNVLAVYTTIHL